MQPHPASRTTMRSCKMRSPRAIPPSSPTVRASRRWQALLQLMLAEIRKRPIRQVKRARPSTTSTAPRSRTTMRTFTTAAGIPTRRRTSRATTGVERMSGPAQIATVLKLPIVGTWDTPQTILGMGVPKWTQRMLCYFTLTINRGPIHTQFMVCPRCLSRRNPTSPRRRL